MSSNGRFFLPWVATMVVALLQSTGCRECENSADCNPGEFCNSSYQCIDQSWELDTGDIEWPTSNDTSGTGEDTATIPPQPQEWIFFDGGTFDMGSERRESEEPVHQVTIQPFYLMRTEVTIGAYEVCVENGDCAKTSTYDGSCTSHHLNSAPNKAANCLRWQNAETYCAFREGRLPTEAEWEYAARSMGQDKKYPWGDTEPDCDLAVGMNCGIGMPEKVCSLPKGKTAQGLCDMAGNVSEWVQDEYHSHYNGAPTDGSAWLDGLNHVKRGGSYNHEEEDFAVTRRSHFWGQSIDIGFRCARNPE